MVYIRNRSSLAATAALVAVAATPMAAAAQAALSQSADVNPTSLVREGSFVRDRNVGVRDRPRPEYSSAGVPVGAWQLLPSVTARLGSNDNIYATKRDRKSDTIYRLQPGAVIQSQWSNHYLEAFASANVVEYQNADRESHTEWTVGTTGRLDIRRDSVVAAGASYERLTEPRTSTGSPTNAAEPVKYNQTKLNVAAVQNFNRLRLAGRLGLRDLDYHDVLSVSGVRLPQRDRSNTEYYAEGRVEYAVSPAASVFVTAQANSRDFRNAPVGFQPRDSSGYETAVGANLDLARLVRGEVIIGYLNQSYNDSRYGDVSGLSLRGSVDYFATPLLTLTLRGERSVEDAAVIGAGGYLASSILARADYELRRNLILTGEVQYENDDYAGIDRLDNSTTFALSAIYLLNRSVSLTGLLQRQDQQSSGSVLGPDFDVNRAQVSVAYQF